MLRFVEDVPVMLEEKYVPNEELHNFTSEPFVEGSLFRTLYMRCQIDVNGITQEIRAIGADKKVTNLLKLKSKSPVLHILRRYNTS